MREAGQCSLKVIPLPHVVLDIFTFEFQGRKRRGAILMTLKLKETRDCCECRDPNWGESRVMVDMVGGGESH